MLGLVRSRADFVRAIKTLCRFLRGRRYSLDIAIACAGSGLESCRGGECSHTTFAIDNAGNFLMPRHPKLSEPLRAKAPIGGKTAALSPKHEGHAGPRIAAAFLVGGSVIAGPAYWSCFSCIPEPATRCRRQQPVALKRPNTLTIRSSRRRHQFPLLHFSIFDKVPSLVYGHPHITRTGRSDCAYLPSGSSTPPLVTLTPYPSCTPPSAFPLVPRHSFRRFSVLSISPATAFPSSFHCFSFTKRFLKHVCWSTSLEHRVS